MFTRSRSSSLLGSAELWNVGGSCAAVATEVDELVGAAVGSAYHFLVALIVRVVVDVLGVAEAWLADVVVAVIVLLDEGGWRVAEAALVVGVGWRLSSGLRGQEHVQDASDWSDERLDLIEQVFRVWDRQHKHECLNDWPSVVEHGNHNSYRYYGLEIQESGEPDEVRARFLDWFELETAVALVSWYLSVASGRVMESCLGAVLGVDVHDLRVLDLLFDRGALAIGVLDEVDIALVVSLRAEARDSHDLPLEVFAVEALGVLLPPDVGHLLTKVALIWMSAVPVVIVRAPELEIRLLGSWVVDACAFWLMQS